MKFVVNTAYQDHPSAIVMMGSSSDDRNVTARIRNDRPASRSSRAHCAMNASSATVATERPRATLERKLS